VLIYLQTIVEVIYRRSTSDLRISHGFVTVSHCDRSNI